MKVGMLTTWNTRCGISEYSNYLVKALRRIDGVDITVFGSKNYDEYDIADERESYVVPTFGVLPWNNYGDHSFDYETILGFDLDILHVQYEVMLYNQEGFNNLLQRSNTKKVITYHDNCIPPTFPWRIFDLAYTHREDVGVGSGFVIPMGIEDHQPVVKTFGLGRSRKDIIGDICEQNGWKFESSFGETDWVDRTALYNWLRDADAIALYYDDVAAAGTSIAARVAISTRRPVFINDVTWFADLEPGDNITKIFSPLELELQLHELFSNYEIEAHSWAQVARMHVQDYKKILE